MLRHDVHWEQALLALRCSGSQAGRRERVRTEVPALPSRNQAITIGAENVLECANCSGLWLDVPSFEKSADREQQAAVLGAAAKERADLEEERRRLRQEQMVADTHHSAGLGIADPDSTRINGIASARGLLEFLLE